ncbi:DUF6461 domain-containing protein [Streptomyces apricus]|uniref:Uncharacterized protein n=1 Tax=Streptomyces apricus TaxID=1828112 RepID=A0A5B0BCN0_9ACTN|nr:DUF6461 domain-containing protein [Streptomyces apricus]KAA0939316.1 hypothetical protein FGF04_11775 [Streptomyces apricus]
MPTPGFPPHTLDPDGSPIWISALATGDPNHILHVVRGIEPAEALEALGAKPALIQPCRLPDRKPDAWTSLPGAALGIAPGTSAALLSGRVGAWTFVYDDSGATYDDTATEALSAQGRTAATGLYTINADASLTYAVDGQVVEWVDVDDLDVDKDLADMPAELRAAFEAAGTVEEEDFEPGEADGDVVMRAACALAGLALTLDDVRDLPLLAAPLG